VHGVDKIDGNPSERFWLTMLGLETILDAGDYFALPAGAVPSTDVVGEEAVISLKVVQ